MLLTLVTAMARFTLACASPTVYLALASSAVPARSSLSSASVRQRLSFSYAAVEATKDIIFCRAVLAELCFHQRHPTTLYVGNTSLITLALVSTLVHPSDLCTKALPPRQFERLRGHMLGSQRVSNEVSASSDSMDVQEER